MATIITQGDQYLMPIIIRQKGTVITDQIATGVKVALNGAVCSWPDGNLTFSNGLWYYPLTQKLTYGLQPGKADFQVQVNLGGKIVGSKKREVEVEECDIKEEWGE